MYNRGNNRENLFHKPENYSYFLRKYGHYLSNWVDTYAYCLLPNHFHLLIRVKHIENLPGFQDLEGLDITKAISQQFRLFFMAYSKAINKQENRTGSLFQKNFRRILVDNPGYFTRLIFYIHANPQLHSITQDFALYPYSSYASIISNVPTKLCRNEVLQWFEGQQGFEEFHRQSIELRQIDQLLIED